MQSDFQISFLTPAGFAIEGVNCAEREIILCGFTPDPELRYVRSVASCRNAFTAVTCGRRMISRAVAGQFELGGDSPVHW